MFLSPDMGQQGAPGASFSTEGESGSTGRAPGVEHR